MLQAVTIPVSEMADRLIAQLTAGPPAGGAGPSSVSADDEWHKLVHFLQLAQNEGFELSEQAAIVEDAETGRIHWAIFAIRSLGRTSLLVFGPLPSLSSSAPLRRAIALLTELERACHVALLQALLPPTQTAEAQVLTDAGMLRLAELIYMQGDLPATLLSAPGAADVWPAQIGDCEQIYTDANAAEFARVIQASYLHTLDCPTLEGVRRMDDVLAGHRASGLFRPDLWFLFCRRSQPIGVVLLNEVLDAGHATVELVYMGLVEQARGQGLGRRMFRFAMRSARRAGFSRIVTAVDSQNPPALRLYRRLGLAETMRRVAFILPLEPQGAE